MTLVAPRIVNDVSCVTRINHGIHFAWQAQYLVNLSCDVCSTEYFSALQYRVVLELYFVVQGSSVVQSSTGVVLCSTE